MSAPFARILVVDDDEGLLILMAEALRAEGYEVSTAGSGREAAARLEENRPDLMLLDLKLQDVAGPALVEQLRRRENPVPFIVVTGQGDEKAAVAVMKQGARDYVMKDSAMLDLLPSIVKRVLGMLAQEQALAEAQRERRRLESEILAIGERERFSIGADLHDGLGQQLTAIELICTGLKADSRGQAPALTEGLELLGRMLRETIVQTRYLAHGLVPIGNEPDALQIGLTELVAYTQSLRRVDCRFDCPADVLLPDRTVAGHLYRIAQEAINNAVKHSRAKQVTVRLLERAGAVVLGIADDGVGLATDRASKGGAGLGVMQHRAGLVGARLEIVSPPGGGVVVTCTLPLNR